MITLGWIILSTFIVSLFALIGIFTLSMKDNILKKIISYLVSLSIGALLAGAFFHLIPEAAEEISVELALIFVLIGILIFLLIEKSFHWRHCHDQECSIHSFAYTNLIGDAMHNFLDGLIIAAAFLLDTRVGFTTTLAILAHELPQEIGDFGVLLHAGMKKPKALFFNFLTALTALLGGILGYFLFDQLEVFIPYILALTAGSFIYIAASDLIPEIRKERKVIRMILNSLAILLGIAIMYSLKFLE